MHGGWDTASSWVPKNVFEQEVLAFLLGLVEVVVEGRQEGKEEEEEEEEEEKEEEKLDVDLEVVNLHRCHHHHWLCSVHDSSTLPSPTDSTRIQVECWGSRWIQAKW